MFTKKHDPLVDSVRSVMEKNTLRRQVEETLNEELGISSRKAVPHEHLADYDAMLEEAYKCAMKEEKPISHSNQKIISKQDGNPASISGKDLAILRAKKKAGEEIKQEETQIDEKAVSKAQHRFFGLVRGIQKGKAHGSAKAEKAAEEMSTKEVRKFAKTKEKGLPEKVDEQQAPNNSQGMLSPNPKAGMLDDPDPTGAAKPAAPAAKPAAPAAKPAAPASGPSIRPNNSQGLLNYDQAPNTTAFDKPGKDNSEVRVQHRINESLESIMEEIRNNLEEQLVAVYESGDEQMFEEFVSSLTEEQIEILGLNEVFGDYAGDPSILNRAANQVYSNQQRQAAGQRTVSVGRPAPTQTARPSATPAAKPATAPAPAAKPATAPAPAAKPATAPKPVGTTNSMAKDSDAERSSQGGSVYTPPSPASRTAPREPIPGTEPAKSSGGYNSENIPVNPISSNKDPGFLRPNREAPSVKPSDIPTVGEPKKGGWFGMGGFPSTQKESTHIKESLESVIRSRYLKG